MAGREAASGILTPEDVIALLKAGNARFAEDRRTHLHADKDRRRETAEGGQRPLATVLSCSDSRVPVELLFDQGIGDLFVIRVPGNVCNDDEIGSIEYGVGHLHTPLCLVLGHTKCGAVTAVVEQNHLQGALARLVASIGESADVVRRETPQHQGKDLVEAVARANVRGTMARLIAGSSIVREAVDRGNVKIVGAMYDIETGVVSWMD
ncbi:MAG TPA: carbonic anhydrase [Candidatus Hydrogenedentes bacterium]|nr:carbonic anhydrase [Candidatus Hydrogenedentota bacterium]